MTRPEIETEMVEEADTAAVQSQRLPAIAILGRPNVGKSTLFNRLVHRSAPSSIVGPVSHAIATSPPASGVAGGSC